MQVACKSTAVQGWPCLFIVVVVVVFQRNIFSVEIFLTFRNCNCLIDPNSFSVLRWFTCDWCCSWNHQVSIRWSDNCGYFFSSKRDNFFEESRFFGFFLLIPDCLWNSQTGCFRRKFIISMTVNSSMKQCFLQRNFSMQHLNQSGTFAGFQFKFNYPHAFFEKVKGIL